MYNSKFKLRTILGILFLLILAVPINKIQAGPHLVVSSTPGSGTIPTTKPTSTSTKTDATSVPKSVMKITLDRDIREFTKAEQEQFIKDLAAALGIDPSQIRIIKIEAGSIIITVEIPTSASQKLATLYNQKDTSIEELHITEIEILPTPTPTISKNTATQPPQIKTPTKHITSTYPQLIPSTSTPVSDSSFFSSSRMLTIFLLVLGAVLILAILGVGGFLLLRPK